MNRIEQIKKGDSGEYISKLKDALNLYGLYTYSSSEITNGTSPIFDDQFEKSVIDFQKKHGLKPDGIIGKKTLAEIAKLPESAPLNKTPIFLQDRETISAINGVVDAISSAMGQVFGVSKTSDEVNRKQHEENLQKIGFGKDAPENRRLVRVGNNEFLGEIQGKQIVLTHIFTQDKDAKSSIENKPDVLPQPITFSFSAENKKGTSIILINNEQAAEVTKKTELARALISGKNIRVEPTNSSLPSKGQEIGVQKNQL